MTNINSQISSPKYVAAVNERLALFNGTVDGDSRPNRVAWSIKGDPFDFTSVGAGFQDLVEMRGDGTGIVASGDQLVLFSDNEVWLGRPTDNIFGFDFFPVPSGGKQNGCPYPRTIAVTDAGPMWLGQDLNVYLLNGNRVISVGDKIHRELEDRRALIDKDKTANVWATYDPAQGHYRITYTLTGNEVGLISSVVLKTNTLARDTGPAWTVYQYSGHAWGVGHENLMVDFNQSSKNSIVHFTEGKQNDINTQTYAWFGHDISRGAVDQYEMPIDVQVEYSSMGTWGVSNNFRHICFNTRRN
jgi:hypothetical protein